MARYLYASLPDVQAHLPLMGRNQVPTFTATSQPNATHVHNQISFVTNELDSVLSNRGYAVPIPTTATIALDIVRSWTSIGAAYRTALSAGQGPTRQHVDFLRDEYNRILESIRNGIIGLADAPKNSFRNSRGMAQFNASPYFTRN